MPPETAVKKAAKKAAKKHAKKAAKHEGKRHEGKDLRRAYEHLGRLSTLEATLTAATLQHIRTLTELAQTSLTAGEHKSAADLLRAGEHLAFGSVAPTVKASRLSDELEETINAEYEHLTDKAEEHWEKHDGKRPAAVAEVYEAMVEAADAAFRKGAYRRALEFARGAEALAHVRGEDAPELEDGGLLKRKKLKG
jgi:hypothetical protein